MNAHELSLEQSQALLATAALAARLELEGLEDIVVFSPRLTGVHVTAQLPEWFDALIFIPWSMLDNFDFRSMLPNFFTFEEGQ